MNGDERIAPLGHDEVRDFYDTAYYGDAVPRGALTLPWHVRAVANRLRPVRGLEVLDIACGMGQWLGEMAQRGGRLAGIDISSRAVAQCRGRFPGADIREGVAESLPFDDGRFDLVTCLGSLEHFLDQPKALREMRRVAKPDAQFLILVPNAGFLSRRLGLYDGTGQVAIRETVRPLAEWATLLSDAGLQVQARWRDLHPLGREWITQGPVVRWPLRCAQALALALWPVAWQYQVYFLCTNSPGLAEAN